MMHYADASRRDVVRVIRFLRDVDARECREIHGVEPNVALGLAWSAPGPTYAVYDDREAVGLCGAVPISPGYASGWLVGTDRLTRRWATFARGSREIADSLVRRFGCLANTLLASNHLHLRWLEWLGADIHTDPTNTNLRRFTLCVHPPQRS